MLTVIFILENRRWRKTDPIRNREAYTRILREEIIPAVGCIEPISISYCAAKAHQVLGMQPTAVMVSVSEDILKNVKGVIVPNTRGLKGVRASVAVGIICGDAESGMQAIESVSDEQHAAVVNFMDSVNIDVSCAETDCRPYISITLYARTSYSRVVIAGSYSNIVEIMKNGEALMKRPILTSIDDEQTDRSFMNLHDIVAYADGIEISEIKDLLDMQIDYNTAICKEGLFNHYGADVGRILLDDHDSDLKTVAKANVAAGMEAHMNGCKMPAALLCGSVDQGIAASVPIVCCATRRSMDAERTYRALIVSDLLTVYLKSVGVQSSATCGAIRAGCAAGAGIAYLFEGNLDAVEQTFRNAVSMSCDMVCDGIKPSCPMKAAAAIESGILGYQIYLRKNENN